MQPKKHIRFDWAAKKILRSKANYKILEGFLSELLMEDIKINKILSEESNKETEKDKSNRVDLLIENSKGEIIIIEIQISRELDYLFRILFGASKVITEYMKEGMPYSYVKKVITVSIVYFNFGQGTDYLYKGQTTFIGLNKHDIFQLSDEQKAMFSKKDVEDIFPEHYLIRVNTFDNIANNTLDEWIYFFKNSEIKDEFKAKGLAEAREVLKVINMSEEELAKYKKFLDLLSSDASLAQTLIFEVEYKRNIEIAKKMIKNQEPIEKVILFTELPNETIEKLFDEIKNATNMQ
jgi:predicted transposase/invertase (TIGR01784 family)